LALSAHSKALKALTAFGLWHFGWIVARQTQHFADSWVDPDAYWFNRPKVVTHTDNCNITLFDRKNYLSVETEGKSEFVAGTLYEGLIVAIWGWQSTRLPAASIVLLLVGIEPPSKTITRI